MIPEVNPFNNYKGDGLATRFDYDFMIENASQLIVQKISENDAVTTLINNVDYEIKEIGNNNGGYIIFPIANSEHSVLGENESISLQLTLPFEQVSEYGQSSLLNLNSLELSLDYLTRLCQILKRQMERSVKASEGNDIIDIALPPPKANNTFAWNEDASALVNYDIIGENNAFKNNIVDSLDKAKNEFNTIIAANKEEMLDIQENFEQENNAKFEAYQDELNTKFETVADAADRINNLDNDLAVATNAAEQATQEAQNAAQQVQNAKEQAEIAANKANEILNVKDELEAEIGVKANVDLDNLSEAGEKHFLGKTQITNCITEIPQRIKLELADGTLTLKAGSEVIIPNGFEADGTTPRFDYVSVESDVTGAYNDTYSRLFCVDSELSYLGGAVITTGLYSGETVPTNLAHGLFWYDTKNNIVKRYLNDVWNEGWSLPICEVIAEKLTNIFNGIGYIGSTVWVDKDVKGLIPNGRNEDGSLKNEEFSASKTLILTLPANFSIDKAHIVVNNEVLALIGKGSYRFDEQNNYLYNNNDIALGVEIGNLSSSSKIDNFQPKQPFRALDYNDKYNITSWAMPSNKTIGLTLGASGAKYTAPANGWFAVHSTTTMNGMLNYDKLNGATGVSFTNYSTLGGRGILPVSKGDIVSFHYTGTPAAIKFIYAEGEV